MWFMLNVDVLLSVNSSLECILKTHFKDPISFCLCDSRVFAVN